MTGFLGTVQLAALATVLFAAVTAIGGAMLYPLLRRRLALLDPAVRAKAVIAWAAAPLLLGAALTAACFMPSLPLLLVASGDHCVDHADHHPHLCLVHRPDSAGSTTGWIVVAIAGVFLAAGVLRRVRETVQARGLLRALDAASRPTAMAGVRLIDVDEPLSMATGGRRGGILMASRLSDSLPAEFLEAVVEHERAHLRRRDASWRVATAFLSVPHLPSVRRRLLADLALACEQACDEEAARRVGDRLRVASAIIAVTRMCSGRAPSVLAPAFGGADVVARVERLMTNPGNDRRQPRSAWLVALATVAIAAMAGPLHHLTETALGLLVR
jgi:Zn-dependent protease with chaperone function